MDLDSCWLGLVSPVDAACVKVRPCEENREYAQSIMNLVVQRRWTLKIGDGVRCLMHDFINIVSQHDVVI